MTTTNQSTFRKVLSIFGLIALIVLVAWLAISLVRVMPGAIASLASLADSVYYPERSQPTLQVTTPSNIINTDESFVITWNELDIEGDYAFSYDCKDEGVALSVQQADGTYTPLNCSEPLYSSNDSSIVILAESNKKRFVDIIYTLTFTPDNTATEPVVATKRLTVVNPDISTSANGTATEPEEPSEPEPTPTPTPSEPVGQTTTETEVVYQIPVSDPNGNIDLAIRHVGVGELRGDTFIPRGEIDMDMQGAFQFAVKNIGTKTAASWSYEAILPNGSTYKSGNQVALQPNEEAIITLGFTTLGTTGIKTIGAEVDAQNDIRSNNNSYSWVMTVVK